MQRIPLQPRKSGAGPQMQGPDGLHSGSPSHMQLPETHSFALPESHALPHRPQLFTSDCVFVQTPVQH